MPEGKEVRMFGVYWSDYIPGNPEHNGRGGGFVEVDDPAGKLPPVRYEVSIEGIDLLTKTLRMIMFMEHLRGKTKPKKEFDPFDPSTY